MPKRQQFSPGVIDYDGRMSAGYQSGRALSQEAASTWIAIVAPFVRRAGRARILDLGAGTGRFSPLFARVFEAPVIGIELERDARSRNWWHNVEEPRICSRCWRVDPICGAR